MNDIQRKIIDQLNDPSYEDSDNHSIIVNLDNYSWFHITPDGRVIRYIDGAYFSGKFITVKEMIKIFKFRNFE